VNNVEQIIVGPTKETKNIQCFTAGASGQSAYPSMCKRIGQFLPNDYKEQWPSVGNDLVEVNIKIHAAKHFLDQLKNPPREGTANAKWMAAIKEDTHAGGYDVLHLTHHKLDIGNLTAEPKRVNIMRNTCNKYSCECKCEGEKCRVKHNRGSDYTCHNV
jgi:hypothetical protein